MFNKNEESSTTDASFLKEYDCNYSQWAADGNKLYEAFKSDPLFVWKDHKPYGSSLIDV